MVVAEFFPKKATQIQNSFIVFDLQLSRITDDETLNIIYWLLPLDCLSSGIAEHSASCRKIRVKKPKKYPGNNFLFDLRDADGAILVYDITDVDSFNKVKVWVKELRKMLGADSISMAIVGNKTDLEKQRNVDAKAAQE